MAREGNRSAEAVIYENNRPFTVKIDYSGGSNPIYIAKAQAGTLVSESFWQILKLTWDGSNCTDVKWADGVTTFTKVYNDRATYTYS